jgi:hypothetical protein
MDGDARWACNLDAAAPSTISESVQRTGCVDHRFNPYLLNQWAEPVDADAAANWVKYRIKATGKVAQAAIRMRAQMP